MALYFLLMLYCVFSHYSLSHRRTQRRGKFLSSLSFFKMFKMCIIEQTAFSFALEYIVSRKCAGAVCVIGNDVLASFFLLGWWFSQNYTHLLHLPPRLLTFPLSFMFFSSAMKRLPYSEEEFGSPPNKLARMDEPKRGVF